MSNSDGVTRRWCSNLALVVVLIGCGRVGFDPVTSATHCASGPCPDAGFDTEQVCPAGSVVCGDFARGLGSFDVFGAEDGDIGVIVDAPGSATGAALELTHGDGGDGFVLAEARFEPIVDGTLYGRALLQVDADAAIPEYAVLLELDDGNANGEQKISVDLHADDSLNFVMTTASPHLGRPTKADTIRRGEWTCLTFAIELADDGQAALTRDHEELVHVDGEDTVPSGGHSRFSLGMTGPSMRAGSVRFDAVALARSPLACPW